MIIEQIFGNRHKINYKNFISNRILTFTSIFGCAIFGSFIIFGVEYLILFILCLILFIYIFRKQEKIETASIREILDEFYLLKNEKNQNYFSLKKQEFLIDEIKFLGYAESWNKKTRKKEFNYDVLGKKFHYPTEKDRIQNEIQNFWELNKNNSQTELQKNFGDLYEKLILGKNENIEDENWIKIKEIVRIRMIERSIFGGFIFGFLYFALPFLIINFFTIDKADFENDFINIIIEGNSLYIFISLLIGIAIFMAKILKSHNNNKILAENFDSIINTIGSYFVNISKIEKIHHLDNLFFADLIGFLSENIENRAKNIKKFEKFIYNNYRILFFKTKAPQEIENFFIQEKFLLKNNAILVQKIVSEWSKIEKSRLEKNIENSENDLIILSNKRQEAMLKNLEKLDLGK